MHSTKCCDCLKFKNFIAATCIQPKKPDTTAGATQHWWYNSVTGLCEPFMWGPGTTTSPASSNGNNFITQEHCYSYCGGSNSLLANNYSICCKNLFNLACQRGVPRLNNRAAFTDPIPRVTTCSADAGCAAVNNLPYTCRTTANPPQCCPLKTSNTTYQTTGVNILTPCTFLVSWNVH